MGKTNYINRVNTLLNDNFNRLITAFRVRKTLIDGYNDIIEDINESMKYTNELPTTGSLGGIETGETFDNVPLSEMLDKLLYPYLYPSFQSFSIQGNVPLECGKSYGGNKVFVWSILNPTNVKTGTITISELSENDLIVGTLNDGTETINVPAGSKVVHGEYRQFYIEALNTKMESFEKETKVYFYSPIYYGVHNTSGLSVSNIQQMTKVISYKQTFTLSFNPLNQRFYYAYPKSFGLLTSIKDVNLFETISDWTVSEAVFGLNAPYYNGNSLSYYVYEFKNLVNATGVIYTFKF